MFVMEQEQRVAWLSVEKFHLNENCQSGRSFNRWKFYFICTPHQLFTTGNNFKRSLTKNSEFWKVLMHDQHQTNVTSKHWTLGSGLVGCRRLLSIMRNSFNLVHFIISHTWSHILNDIGGIILLSILFLPTCFPIPAVWQYQLAKKIFSFASSECYELTSLSRAFWLNVSNKN